jgi:hypothetical protein
MTTAEQLIEREAMRRQRDNDDSRRLTRNSFATRIRDIVLDDRSAIEHDIRRKAVVSAHDSPLDGLSGYHNVIAEIERRSVLARIGAAWVPFETQAAVLTTPAAAYWVARTDPKPVSKFGLAGVKLSPTKIATLIVLTNDVLRLGGGPADDDLEAQMASGVAGGLNRTLLGNGAGTPDVEPAGLLNGITPTPATGLSDAEIFEDLIAALTGMLRPTIVAALPIALRIRAALGAGSGDVPIVVEPEAGTTAIIVDARAVAHSIGGLDVDRSRNTSLAMADNPDSPAEMVSMFQTNSIAIRTELYANWEVVRPAGIAAIDFAEGS